MTGLTDDPPCPQCQYTDWTRYQIGADWFMHCRICEYKSKEE